MFVVCPVKYNRLCLVSFFQCNYELHCIIHHLNFFNVWSFYFGFNIWIQPISLIWSIIRTLRLVSIIIVVMPAITIILMTWSVIIWRLYFVFIKIIRMIIFFFSIGWPWWFYLCTPCNLTIWSLNFGFQSAIPWWIIYFLFW